MLNGAVSYIDLALVQQVMMSYRKKRFSVVKSLLQLLLNPFISFRIDHSAHLIVRLILAGIQHHQPKLVVQIVGIAQRKCIPAV